ncbi:MAG: amino acid permease C-terminal domain-containing protein, partial [Holophaga sp.]|nr:amino acid permease C-terminal domain-containing protein [Holophaga sp.]
GLMNIEIIVELANIGTLFAFAIVCAAVMILRVKRPEALRRFRTPWVWFVGLAGIFACIWLAAGLGLSTWIRFFIWLLLGLVVYFLYGYWNSILHDKSEKA